MIPNLEAGEKYNIPVYVINFYLKSHKILWMKWITDDNVKAEGNETLHPMRSRVFVHNEVVKWMPYLYSGSPTIIREPGVEIYSTQQASFVYKSGYCGGYEVTATGAAVSKVFPVNVTGNWVGNCFSDFSFFFFATLRLSTQEVDGDQQYEDHQ